MLNDLFNVHVYFLSLELFLAWLVKSIDMDTTSTNAKPIKPKPPHNLTGVLKVENDDTDSNSKVNDARETIKKLAEGKILNSGGGGGAPRKLSRGRAFSMPKVAVETEPCGDLIVRLSIALMFLFDVFL